MNNDNFDDDYKLQFSCRFRDPKKNIDELPVVQFANAQSNFNDTIRYLIQKEIAENGIRNLNQIIPSSRGSIPMARVRRAKNDFESPQIASRFTENADAELVVAKDNKPLRNESRESEDVPTAKKAIPTAVIPSSYIDD